jgi:ATP-dependent phosphofructokinase / diphosphate-dependent phosphofructokinase
MEDGTLEKLEMICETANLHRLGILTGGGDCPGLNAVIRAIAKTAMTRYGVTVIGVEDGFEGLIEGRMRELSNADVSGILTLGGTILGTSNKGDPFHYPVVDSNREVRIIDASKRALQNYRDWKLDALVTVGGDGTMHISQHLYEVGVNVVGVPKTIDNDLGGTDITFGYDSALFVATEAIDRLHTTASAHHRVMVIEVMGRYAGWIALGAGVAGGADIILIPEIPFYWESICHKVIERGRQGKRFSILCVAEGARPAGGELTVKDVDVRRTDAVRLGGIGEKVANEIYDRTGLETRFTVLGHLQRGGSPTPFDRLLATKFGTAACELATAGEFGRMVSLRGTEVTAVRIQEAIAQDRKVPIECQLIQSARAVGTSFGD